MQEREAPNQHPQHGVEGRAPQGRGLCCHEKKSSRIKLWGCSVEAQDSLDWKVHGSQETAWVTGGAPVKGSSFLLAFGYQKKSYCVVHVFPHFETCSCHRQWEVAAAATAASASAFSLAATRSFKSEVESCLAAFHTCFTPLAHQLRQGHTREALLSEAGFEKVFRTQNWVRRSKLFCRWFCSLLGQAGCISVAAWTRWKLASYYLVSSGGLIVCCC